jgi:3-oxoadipate enol-lactonase
MSQLVLPWVPEGRLVAVEGRGELFARIHHHPDPDAPVVLLLHGWTASSDLQFVMAYAALAERYTIVGIDHRGHGRGLRSPDRFALEDAADDAAALVGALGLGPVFTVGYSMGGPISMLLARRHPGLVRGLVVQATALDWRHTRRDRVLWRILPIAGSWVRSRGYRWYLNRAVPKYLGVGGEGEHPVRPYVPWLVSEMSRNDPFVMVEAGAALSRYDARPWASSLGLPAASLVTTADRMVPPAQQYALATALGATVRELAANHFAALSHPAQFAALTVELVEDVRQRASSGAVSSPVVA